MSVLVDSGYAAWLKTEARQAAATGAGAAAWGDEALESAVLSPLAFEADAQAEAARQARLLAGPIVRDTVIIAGLRRDLVGRLVTVTGDRAGYEAGADVFVIGAQEADPGRTTTLTVLKRL